jgi:hypothetical protein
MALTTELLSAGFAPLGLAVVIAFVIARVFREASKLHAPRIGRAPNLFGGRAKARAEFLANGKILAEDGYTKVREIRRKERCNGWTAS